MTELPPIYDQVIKRLGQDQFVRPCDVIAVCLQETDGSPIFSTNDPLFRANLNAAIHGTTLPEALLLDALLIKAGPNKGLIPKFRFEPAYWEWTKTQKLSSPTLRFLCACSFGVGQQMMRWVLPADQKHWPIFIENFKADVDVQLTYLISNLRNLMVSNGGSLIRVYKQYNSGDPFSKDPAVEARALHVIKLRDIVEQQLKGR